MLDTAIELETPEGVGIELRAAGIFARGMALMIDEFVRLGIVMVASMTLGAVGDFGFGILLLVVFAVYWLYGVAFEVLRNGQTPGKRSQKLRVVHDDGTAIGLSASLLRNLLLVIDYLPAFYAVGLVSMMLSGRFRRLGDLAGGTLVVYVDGAPKPDAQDSNAEPTAAARPPPVALSLAEQGAIIQYAERRAVLSEARRQELAEILQPVLDCSAGECAGELDRVANGLKGGV